MDDSEVEAQIDADRLGMTIQHTCEWELRELDSFVGAMLEQGRADKERNPLRPDVLGKALVTAVEAVTDRAEIRKVLAAEIARALAVTMPGVYRDIVADLRGAGIQPLSMAVRTVASPGTTDSAAPRATARRRRPTTSMAAADSAALGLGAPRCPPRGRACCAPAPAAPRLRCRAHHRAALRAGHLHGGGAQRGTPIGQVDPQLMELIRRLAFLGNAAAGVETGQDSGSGGSASRPMTGSGLGGLNLPNLIHTHRDELRQASTGTLDHMVIDVVGSLFDQILSDPKVPPQMARQIARLQLPVLRVALGDATFFSSRRHPVRRFVNRIASLACAFDDLSERRRASTSSALVRDLVQEIVDGDFDQMEVYEREADPRSRPSSPTRPPRRAGARTATPPRCSTARKRELRMQQRYMQQLRAALKPRGDARLPARFPGRRSGARRCVQAGRRDDGGGARPQRLRARRARARHERAAQGLAGATQDLPDAAAAADEGPQRGHGADRLARCREEGLLRPAAAGSRRVAEGAAADPQLDYNLLVKQIDAILARAAAEGRERRARRRCRC